MKDFLVEIYSLTNRLMFWILLHHSADSTVTETHNLGIYVQISSIDHNLVHKRKARARSSKFIAELQMLPLIDFVEKHDMLFAEIL